MITKKYYTIFLGSKLYVDDIDDMNEGVWKIGGMIWENKKKALAYIRNRNRIRKRNNNETDNNKFSIQTLTFKHKTMSETKDEVKSEQAIDEAIDNVPEKAEGEKLDKESDKKLSEIAKRLKADAEIMKANGEERMTIREEADSDEKVIMTAKEKEEALDEFEKADKKILDSYLGTTEPLYQKKVYTVDLKNIGIKVIGEELIVDVMEVKDGKAKIECGQVKCEVPKDFLF